MRIRPAPLLVKAALLRLERKKSTPKGVLLIVNEDKVPKLHMHSAFGRSAQTVTGCTREGVFIWHIGEVIIFELTKSSAQRKVNPVNGFELLEV